ncbi:tRNA (adenosine(37)-N6)-dimethylallyltransferase MiaA [candidate division WWE3 bacterium RIFCSPHIGHO2_01_FULL_42_13]|uniref:tRNA dimethylallyltransferase n=1 Tax=candidate division WWE3 bacterium RIFCSPHIGHO2_01_FULL_42_13 TaxID=1802617 RepID=A0A1F4UR61_UNCKA|nr:MAG: tRNA (adenosine(37)-N6)-dimethylallyltransferase MiaA [candidate division WWE3 bacterium RIFCSPHIGHO2_01_FULL_42_13]
MATIFVILGPTSSGKTSTALDLCKRSNGEIISTDSRQIYKGMDIGTGKTPINTKIKVEKGKNHWVLDGIKVWGYDLINPDEYFSAYDFAKWALPKAQELLEQGKAVYLVGGTGFFIDMFTGRAKPSRVKPDFNLRNKLEKLSLSELQKKLMSLNPEAYEKIDKNNHVRLIRAIEIETGKNHSPTPLPYLQNVKFEYTGLDVSREVLYERADVWLDSIWQNGLLPETQNLISAGFGETRPLNGIVYKSTKAFLVGQLSEDEAKQQAKFDLHAYIRRQQTYFKKNKDIKWLNNVESN